MALLSCVSKVIRYVVLTMHILKIRLGFFKKSLMFSTFLDSRLKTSLNEEKVGCYATWE